MYTDEWLRVGDAWLHYQDWPPRPAGDRARAATVLLLHGLTQQSHTFDAVARELAPTHRSVALDLRGRGESSWAPGTYTIPHYVADVLALLDALGIDAVHVLGTSLGGLVSLSLAAAAPLRVRSIALNDIGPDIDPRGAARVTAYAASVPESFADLAAAQAWMVDQYPWLAGRAPEAVADAVRWAVRRDPRGRWRLKFDPAIGRGPRPSAEAVRAASGAWWAALEGLRCPVLLVRGAESDILGPETAAMMATRQPRLVRVDIAGVGHAPTLAEPEAVAALATFYRPEAAPAQPAG